MKKWMLLAFACCLLADVTSFAANVPADDDDEYEEVVVRRKKKRSKEKTPAVKEQPSAVVDPVVVPVASPVVAPVAVAPVATVVVPTATVVTVPVATPTVPTVPAVPEVPAAPTVTKDDEPPPPPPPPEPPAADAAEPRRLVRYFCKAWKDKDYERLWWSMSPQYRKEVSLEKLKKNFESDAEMNGGLLDENIIETGRTKDGNEGVRVELIFKYPRAKHRLVTAVAERQTGGAFRLVESPFIPKDLDDL